MIYVYMITTIIINHNDYYDVYDICIYDHYYYDYHSDYHYIYDICISDH